MNIESARRSNYIWWLAGTTPLAIVLAHYLAVLPHEFMRSFVAWATGIKSNPFDIHWGEASPGNVLLLYYIDEKVDYKAAYAAGKSVSVAAAVIAGPGTNAVLYVVARWVAPLWAPALGRSSRIWRSGFCSCSSPMCTTMSRSGWPHPTAMSGNGFGPRTCLPGSSTSSSVIWCCGR
jgi:hypothetical protein